MMHLRSGDRDRSPASPASTSPTTPAPRPAPRSPRRSSPPTCVAPAGRRGSLRRPKPRDGGLRSDLMAQSRRATWAEHALATLEEAGYRSGGRARRGDRAARQRGLRGDRARDRRRLRRRSRGRPGERLSGARAARGAAVWCSGSTSVATRPAYERVEPGGHHHHHVVCERCGRVVPFEDEDLERAIGRVSRGAGLRDRRPRGDAARHLRPLLPLSATPTRSSPGASRRCRGRRG